MSPWMRIDRTTTPKVIVTSSSRCGKPCGSARASTTESAPRKPPPTRARPRPRDALARAGERRGDQSNHDGAAERDGDVGHEDRLPRGQERGHAHEFLRRLRGGEVPARGGFDRCAGAGRGRPHSLSIANRSSCARLDHAHLAQHRVRRPNPRPGRAFRIPRKIPPGAPGRFVEIPCGTRRLQRKHRGIEPPTRREGADVTGFEDQACHQIRSCFRRRLYPISRALPISRVVSYSREEY